MGKVVAFSPFLSSSSFSSSWRRWWQATWWRSSTKGGSRARTGRSFTQLSSASPLSLWWGESWQTLLLCWQNKIRSQQALLSQGWLQVRLTCWQRWQFVHPSAQSCHFFVLAQSCRCRGARDVQGRGSKSSPSSKSCLGRDGTFSSSCQLQCPLQGGTNNYNITAVIMAPNYVQYINWNHAEPIVNAVTNPRWSLTWSRRGSCSQSQPLLLPGQLKRCLACSIAHPLKWLFLIIKLSYETEQTLHFSSGLLCQRWHSCVPGITVDRHDAWPSFVDEDDMWLPNHFSNFIHRGSGMHSSWPLTIFCFCSALLF